MTYFPPKPASPPPAGVLCRKCGWHHSEAQACQVAPVEGKASTTQVGGDHYKRLAIQPSEYIFRNNLNWLAGNIVKYASRAGSKGPARQDIEKIIHYAELWLEWLPPQFPPGHVKKID